MRLTLFRLLAALAFSAVVSFALFFGTSGILGPYGQPNDLYHLSILFLLLTLTVAFLLSQIPAGRKK